MNTYDITIVGGGIVGLATALALVDAAPHLHIAVLEKEADVGRHQTGHNSGVIHAGIYYKPGSLKATLCVEGARLMYDFCGAHDIPCERSGKVIVALDESEFPALDELLRRGTANKVPGLEEIGQERLRELEPHAAGLRGIHSPHTGVVNFGRVAEAMAEQLLRTGVHIRTNHQVTGIVESRSSGSGTNLVIETSAGDVAAGYVINCAGLYSDVIARFAGAEPHVAIVPFRGEYYALKPERRHLVRGLIYPVPNPALPFLGVHFSRNIDGGVDAGPNAVLAFAREGYSAGRVRADELWNVLSHPGFRTVAKKYWRVGMYEMYRSLNKGAFVRSLQRLVPDVARADLQRGGAGVRAQAVTRAGVLCDDFELIQSEHALHVLNAPSPAATASLAIGRRIAAIAVEQLSAA